MLSDVIVAALIIASACLMAGPCLITFVLIVEAWRGRH